MGRSKPLTAKQRKKKLRRGAQKIKEVELRPQKKMSSKKWKKLIAKERYARALTAYCYDQGLQLHSQSRSRNGPAGTSYWISTYIVNKGEIGEVNGSAETLQRQKSIQLAALEVLKKMKLISDEELIVLEHKDNREKELRQQKIKEEIAQRWRKFLGEGLWKAALKAYCLDQGLQLQHELQYRKEKPNFRCTYFVNKGQMGEMKGTAEAMKKNKVHQLAALEVLKMMKLVSD